MSADPLSFFTACGSDDDDDGSDSDNSNSSLGANVAKEVETQDFKMKESALPPPLMALSKAKTPEFVTRHIRADIDWDKNVKEAPYVPPKEFKPWESALPAVETKSKVKDRKPDLTIVKQVPQSITSAPPSSKPVVKDKTQYTDHAISWSKMYKDADVQNTIGKRPRPEDDDEDLAGFCHTDLDGQKVAFQVKHQKTAIKAVTFRDKEKRKRDSGQANREKMFVEEEKRILRQNFDG
ncbi:unnamed protein product [Clavelina lepadiformis]|uniref:Uncharacterized protein n=1 Tax=Clavelina lepadiformis TaxID=159417 RepID=A0ABP0GFR3_CLALP